MPTLCLVLFPSCRTVNQFGNLLSIQDGLSTGGIFFGNADRPGAATDFVGAIGDVGDGQGSSIRVVGAEGGDGVAERTFLDEFLQFGGPNSIIGSLIFWDHWAGILVFFCGQELCSTNVMCE